MTIQECLDKYKETFSSNQNINSSQITEHIEELIKIKFDLFSGSTFYILIDMTDNSINYVSDNMSQILGYSADTILDEGLQFYISLIHQDEVEIWSNILNDLMTFTKENISNPSKSKLSYSYNYRIKHRNGHYLNLLENQVPILYDKEGKPIISFGKFTLINLDKKLPITSTIDSLNDSNEYHRIYSKTYTSINFLVLTKREIEVLKLISLGNTTKEISDDCFISIKTIENHRSNICRKLKLPKTNNSLSKFSLQHEIEILNL